MKRHLYFVKTQGRKAVYEDIIAAFSEANARAVAEEYYENVVVEVRLCTLEDINNIEDRRIMHMSHIMTPLDIEVAKSYGVK